MFILSIKSNTFDATRTTATLTAEEDEDEGVVGHALLQVPDDASCQGRGAHQKHH